MNNPTRPIDRPDHVQRSAGLSAADVHGEVVILDVQKGTYLSLDAVGSDIWHRLETEQSTTRLISGLSADYDAPIGRIERDVMDLLAHMASRGLVVLA